MGGGAEPWKGGGRCEGSGHQEPDLTGRDAGLTEWVVSPGQVYEATPHIWPFHTWPVPLLCRIVTQLQGPRQMPNRWTHGISGFQSPKP